MEGFDLHSYDKYIVCMSGGKDSIDSYLELKEAGIPKEKIEFWHHDIDGELREGENNFMDWPITKGYVLALGKALGIPVFFSWRDGGFKGEMLRNGQYTASKELGFDLSINSEKKEFCKRNIIVKKTVLDTMVSFTMQEVRCYPVYKFDKETGEVVFDEKTGEPVVLGVDRMMPTEKIGEEFTLLVDKAAFTGAIFYEDETHEIHSTTPSYNPIYLGKREKFPQVTADLQTRWCSSALKIDVCAAAIRNQDRFKGIRTLVITGERSQESMSPHKFEQLMAGTLPEEERKGRATYNIVEIDRSDNRDGGRYIDHYRPLRDKREEEIWDRMKRHGIRPHVAYELGYGRVSCVNCIFGRKDQWASNNVIVPQQVGEVIDFEQQFGITIDRKLSVKEMIEQGEPYASITPERIALANARVYPFDVIIDPEDWTLPAGAFKEGCGSP